ncbi:transposase [Amycolatopsis sp. NPDC058986]|uniref:transposase n=1 Tax=unclassified Amycolatopsis TaxID=2618356 RepID=UPI00366C08E5
MAVRLSLRLVPDEMWALVKPLLRAFEPRPQGGGTAPLDARAEFTAIVYVLISGCAVGSGVVVRCAVPHRARRFPQ